MPLDQSHRPQRIEVDLEAEIELLPADGRPVRVDRWARILNLSSGGILVFTTLDLAPGVRVKIRRKEHKAFLPARVLAQGEHGWRLAWERG